MANTFKQMGAAALAALALALPAAGQAQSLPKNLETAAELRRLDMMLMVTSLRCRNGADNFQPEYDRFRTTYMPQLRSAALKVTAEFTRQLGPRGAANAFDRMSVAMANYYGAGHPRFDCAQLKQEVIALGAQSGDGPLFAAADRLLDDEGSAGAVLARR